MFVKPASADKTTKARQKPNTRKVPQPMVTGHGSSFFEFFLQKGGG